MILAETFEPLPVGQGKAKLKTIEDFARLSGRKASTIEKNHAKIPGCQPTADGEYLFVPGTRYPFNVAGHKLDTDADRRYVLLKAISRNEYISHNELRLEESQFNALLNDYLAAGYIRPNNLGNQFGANAYDCTSEGSVFLEELQKKKRQKRQETFDRFFKLLQTVASLRSEVIDAAST